MVQIVDDGPYRGIKVKVMDNGGRKETTLTLVKEMLAYLESDEIQDEYKKELEEETTVRKELMQAYPVGTLYRLKENDYYDREVLPTGVVATPTDWHSTKDNKTGSIEFLILHTPVHDGMVSAILNPDYLEKITIEDLKRDGLVPFKEPVDINKYPSIRIIEGTTIVDGKEERYQAALRTIGGDMKANLSLEEIEEGIRKASSAEAVADARRTIETMPPQLKEVALRYPVAQLFRVKLGAPYRLSVGGSIVSISGVGISEGEDGSAEATFRILISPIGMAGLKFSIDDEYLEPITMEELRKTLSVVEEESEEEDE